MVTLREARESGCLGEFIKERATEAKGDAAALNRGLASMAGKSSEAPKALSRRKGGG